MPGISVRGATKDKFLAKCRENGISMSKQLEKLIIETMGPVRQEGDVTYVRMKNK